MEDQKHKRTNSKWCNSNRGGLAFSIKKIQLWNDGQTQTNVKVENKAGGLVYDWDFLWLYFKLEKEDVLDYLEDHAHHGVVHFRKFVKNKDGFNAALKTWRKAKRPMDDEGLRKALKIGDHKVLTSEEEMRNYMLEHKEWDEEAMSEFEVRVQQKKKELSRKKRKKVNSSQQASSTTPIKSKKKRKKIIVEFIDKCIIHDDGLFFIKNACETDTIINIELYSEEKTI
mmetsp:Transcript_8790/g.13029  ORF Transcript_8790/g.13029 Transcript_8790/m.13029 type:complete len:227 (+) Transcript_8790:22-702(+)